MNRINRPSTGFHSVFKLNTEAEFESPENNSAFVSFGNPSSSLSAHFPDSSNLIKFFERYSILSDEKNLLLNALRNFARQINLIELQDELCSGEITEEEFENKIETESFKFILSEVYGDNDKNRELAISLMHEFGPGVRDFSESDVFELFGVPTNEPKMIER